MEPEILTAIDKDGKHIVLGIGFFHGKYGEEKDFEVYTPRGKWNGISTPSYLWLLAKMHALCADS